jgi:hypothetical protein
MLVQEKFEIEEFKIRMMYDCSSIDQTIVTSSHTNF